MAEWAAIVALFVLIIALIIFVALFEQLPAKLRGRFSQKGPDTPASERNDKVTGLYNTHLL